MLPIKKNKGMWYEWLNEKYELIPILSLELGLFKII